MMELSSETNEVVDLVHSLVLQSRPPPSSGFDESSTPSRLKIKSVPSSPCAVIRTNTVPVRKKVEIKSAPLKPPDIGNASLFPSMEETTTPPSRRIQLKSSPIGGVSPGNLTDKLATLEAKLTQPRRASLPISDQLATSTNVSTPSRKTPRSAKLFNELSTERRLHLDKLAAKYSASIDANNCRNILDEMEFLLQLFNTSTPLQKSDVGGIPLLSSAAEQAYFAIKVVISQLDTLFTSLPPFILQLIIDNYPHKIPKPVRKHIEDWIEKRSGLNRPLISSCLPPDLSKTVTFRSETDGRSNFLQQQDFHAFCKQRDLFYSIRETWTPTQPSTPSPVIMDRRQARMSFPPPAPGWYTGHTLQFKVQSLFQMNSSPTNLFHMATLFVSHYLLEQRAAEVGGVPKDDHMKEFFQSNPEKLLQLNSRFCGSEQTSETDQVLPMTFQKQFLLAASPKFVCHLVDRLVQDISGKENNTETFTGEADLICRGIKDTVYLARLLGFANYLGYLPEEGRNNQGVGINSIERETVLQEQVKVRSCHKPPLDLEKLLDNSGEKGRLSVTVLWIVEFLLQSDPLALMLPGYQQVLKKLLGIYKSCRVGGSLDGIAVGNRNLIRFQLGVLFSSKIFPDKVFILIKSVEEFGVIGDVEGRKGPDQNEVISGALVEFFFHDTFKRFRRTLSWGKLEVSHPAITGEFRHIRPIPAANGVQNSDPNKLVLTTLTKEKQLQTQMESTFFEQYPPAVKRSVDFVAERIAANFIAVAKQELFPSLRSSLQNQGLCGVRAAEKCRAKLSEEMNKYLNERCLSGIKLFLDCNITPGVLGICQRIAYRKTKETGSDWIKNYINAAMFPDIIPPAPGDPQVASTPVVKPPPPADPPFEVLILLHRTLRKLHTSNEINPQYIDKILTCSNLSQSPYLLNPLIDWGLALITFQPKSLNVLRQRQLVSLWKSLWTSTSSSKLLNPRNLMILSKSKNARDSWINLGNVTQYLINDGLISPGDLEQQCMTLLREDWPDPVHKRISEFLTIVLESFQERQEYQGSDSAQVLDWVAWLCSGQPDQD